MKHRLASEAGTLLSVEFVTLSDYLHLLQGVSQLLSDCRRSALLYLAAAVSDFYIPACDMASISNSKAVMILRMRMKTSVHQRTYPLATINASDSYSSEMKEHFSISYSFLADQE